MDDIITAVCVAIFMTVQFLISIMLVGFLHVCTR